ncbi:MAG TPA: hypothetical protein VK991_10775 [Halomonas sp.]|nr:hypothetical protein [Halomonas sp.]
MRTDLNKAVPIMTTERYQQLHYTCIFLQVSFQAVLRSVETSRLGKACTDDTPCWLDAKLIAMLMRELRRVRAEAANLEAPSQALDSAIYHTGLLLAQCPGALNRRLCRHHLEAIIAPLRGAARELAEPAAAPGWPAAAKRLLSRWRAD